MWDLTCVGAAEQPLSVPRAALGYVAEGLDVQADLQLMAGGQNLRSLGPGGSTLRFRQKLEELWPSMADCTPNAFQSHTAWLPRLVRLPPACRS